MSAAGQAAAAAPSRPGVGTFERFLSFQSGAALATVVGVPVEVPVMLSVVHLVRASRGWYEAGTARHAAPGA